MRMLSHPFGEVAPVPVYRRRSAAREIEVGGYVPLSTTDFPGELAAVVFCQGCPWRCHYCHNPHLQASRSDQAIAWCVLRETLRRRRGLLDAVVFSGGEPTAQTALYSAIDDARGMGFRIGLHTAGIYPRRLKRLLPLLDWVGFDIKTSFADYSSVTGIAAGITGARESLHALLQSGVEYEVRTTVHPDLIHPNTLTTLAQTLAGLGVRRYVLQEFRARGCADGTLRASPTAGYLDDDYCRGLRGLFESFELRCG